MGLPVSIYGVEKGQRVVFTSDGSLGTVVHVNDEEITVLWDDNQNAIFPKRDGFVGFVLAPPICVECGNPISGERYSIGPGGYRHFNLICPPRRLTREQAMAEFLMLVASYGIAWRNDVPSHAWDRLAKVNEVLTEADRREAIGQR